MKIGQKIKALRTVRKFTLEELGELVEVSHASIYKFENDIRKPSPITLQKISKALEVDISFFYDPPNKILEPDDIEFNPIAFREDFKIDDKERVISYIKKECIDFLVNFLQLKDILEIKDAFENPLENFKIASEKDIVKAAKIVRKKWKLGYVPIEDVTKLLEDKGVSIVQLDFQGVDFSGLSGIVNDNIPIIVVNKTFNEVTRKRFTILHELGHIILQFAEDFSDDVIEKFCNRFAGTILLVDEVIHDELGRNRTSISMDELKALKEKYGISISAIIVRARQSGFIDYQHYLSWRDIYKELVEEGTADFGCFTGKETPQRFNILLARCLREQRITESKAAEMSDCLVTEIRDKLNQVTFEMA